MRRTATQRPTAGLMPMMRACPRACPRSWACLQDRGHPAVGRYGGPLARGPLNGPRARPRGPRNDRRSLSPLPTVAVAAGGGRRLPACAACLPPPRRLPAPPRPRPQRRSLRVPAPAHPRLGPGRFNARLARRPSREGEGWGGGRGGGGGSGRRTETAGVNGRVWAGRERQRGERAPGRVRGAPLPFHLPPSLSLHSRAIFSFDLICLSFSVCFPMPGGGRRERGTPATAGKRRHQRETTKREEQQATSAVTHRRRAAIPRPETQPRTKRGCPMDGGAS